MKITLTKKELKRVLTLAVKITRESSRLHPALDLLMVTPQLVTALGFGAGTEFGLEIELDAIEHEDGVIYMEWADLQAYLSQSDGDITIESKADFKVKMTCKNGIDIDMTTQGTDPNMAAQVELPRPKKFEKVFKGFQDDLRRCVTYMASEKMRYALNTVFFKRTKTKLQIAGADGPRIYTRTAKMPDGKKFEVLIPSIIQNFIKEFSDDTQFNVDEKNKIAFFKLDRAMLWTKIVEDSYPKIEDIIPKGKAVNHIDFKEPITKKVLGALKKLRTDPDKNNAVALIKPTAGKPLEVTAITLNDSEKVTTLKIPCKGRLTTKRGFNKHFIYEALVEQPEKINFFERTQPIIILYKNGGKAVLMPVNI